MDCYSRSLKRPTTKRKRQDSNLRPITGGLFSKQVPRPTGPLPTDHEQPNYCFLLYFAVRDESRQRESNPLPPDLQSSRAPCSIRFHRHYGHKRQDKTLKRYLVRESNPLLSLFRRVCASTPNPHVSKLNFSSKPPLDGGFTGMFNKWGLL